jgi:hypothetical protein
MLAVYFMMGYFLACLLAVKIEGTYSSETSVNYRRLQDIILLEKEIFITSNPIDPEDWGDTSPFVHA